MRRKNRNESVCSVWDLEDAASQKSADLGKWSERAKERNRSKLQRFSEHRSVLMEDFVSLPKSKVSKSVHKPTMPPSPPGPPGGVGGDYPLPEYQTGFSPLFAHFWQTASRQQPKNHGTFTIQRQPHKRSDHATQTKA